jgi:hypothetical protein
MLKKLGSGLTARNGRSFAYKVPFLECLVRWKGRLMSWSANHVRSKRCKSLNVHLVYVNCQKSQAMVVFKIALCSLKVPV